MRSGTASCTAASSIRRAGADRRRGRSPRSRRCRPSRRCTTCPRSRRSARREQRFPTSRTSPSSTRPSTPRSPRRRATYAVPRRWREDWGVRRYGFHGIAVEWVASQVTAARLVVCHLGGGCSVTAVRDGRSVDTTMGFSPLEGVPMATRSGSIDPGVLALPPPRARSFARGARPALEHESGLAALGGLDDALGFAVFTYRIAAAVAADGDGARGDRRARLLGRGRREPRATSATRSSSGSASSATSPWRSCPRVRSSSSPAPCEPDRRLSHFGFSVSVPRAR